MDTGEKWRNHSDALSDCRDAAAANFLRLA